MVALTWLRDELAAKENDRSPQKLAKDMKEKIIQESRRAWSRIMNSSTKRMRRSALREMDAEISQLGRLVHAEMEETYMEECAADLTPQLVTRTSRRSPGGKACQDLLSFQGGGYWDDAKGGWLDPKMVLAGRREEMQYVRRHQVYQRVPRQQCWAETGRPPIRTGWADTNKGTSDAPNVRCRWVAKQYR